MDAGLERPSLLRRFALPGLCGLALLSSWSSLSNGFAYDDVPAIRDNPAIHLLRAPWAYVSEPYWSYPAAQYRPLTVSIFALEWRIGGGAPLPFHLANVVLYVATVALVFLLARRLFSPGAAWAAAAFFAVHPVHVEAVGNIVGQAELIVAACSLVAMALYRRVRAAGDPGPAGRWGLALLTLTAPLAKEQGAMLPALFLAAELTLVEDRRAWRPRIRGLAPTAVLVLLASGLYFALRWHALGSLGGGPLAATLVGLSPSNRGLTLLRLVPEWTRLLVWPARLQADYSPSSYTASQGFHQPEAVGLLLLLAAGWAAVAAPDRRIRFGALWTMAALVPVSNLLFPTGILLAERTLFLPSVGVVLVAGALVEGLRTRLASTRGLRIALAGIMAVVLALGAFRSRGRQAAWRDSQSLLQQTLLDDPGNYRAHLLQGRELAATGRLGEARRALETAAQLYQGDPQVFEELGQVLRREGDCASALLAFQRALAIDSTRAVAQSRLSACRRELAPR